MEEPKGPQGLEEYIDFWRHRLEKIARLLRKYCKQNQKFLDIGCADGSVTSFILKGLTVEAYGVDSSKEFVEKAKTSFICKLCDVGKDRFPYPSDFFDVAHAGEIIEHVIDTDHLLSEIWRILKPGGILVISTPNLASWVNRILLVFGFQPFDVEVSEHVCVGLPLTKRGQWHPVSHVRAFTLRALKALLILNDFKIMENHGTSSIVPFVIVKWVDRICDSLIPSLSRTTILVAEKTMRSKNITA